MKISMETRGLSWTMEGQIVPSLKTENPFTTRFQREKIARFTITHTYPARMTTTHGLASTSEGQMHQTRKWESPKYTSFTRTTLFYRMELASTLHLKIEKREHGLFLRLEQTHTIGKKTTLFEPKIRMYRLPIPIRTLKETLGLLFKVRDHPNIT